MSIFAQRSQYWDMDKYHNFALKNYISPECIISTKDLLQRNLLRWWSSMTARKSQECPGLFVILCFSCPRFSCPPSAGVITMSPEENIFNKKEEEKKNKKKSNPFNSVLVKLIIK